jgi:xanthine dehydrogenase molybdopterin-binding subunit B
MIVYRQGLLLLNLTHGLQFDEKGQLLSNNLANYKIPDLYFISDRIDIKFFCGGDK